MIKYTMIFLSSMLILSGCVDSHKNAQADKAALATEIQKSDSGIDVCDYYGWYDDDECDDGESSPIACPNLARELASAACDGQAVTARCGGRLGLTCGEDEFCDYELEHMCGAADHLGTCKPLPDVCVAVFDPVCGCDGVTYSNACDANTNGVSVAFESECENVEPESQHCGGFLGLTCKPGQFCDYELGDMCGAADQLGTCRDVPSEDECVSVLISPVCGCDNNTYASICDANTNGVSVAFTGECDGVEPEPTPEPQHCGGFAGLTCEAGQFCDYQLDDMCGAADQLGTCSDIPSEDECISVLISPVCGCDNNTYASICDANTNGVAVANTGECRI